MIWLQLLLFGFIANFPRLSLQNALFSDNCGDLHFKNIVCVATQVDDCNSYIINSSEEKNGSIYELPGEAHDLRIESFTKTKSSLDHSLSVEISWQTPPNNSTRFLRGFLLKIAEEKENKKPRCFVFNVTGSNWTAETIAHSPRLHFSTESLFMFSQNYLVSVYSLPSESEASANAVHQSFNAPQNPNGGLISVNCTKFSHPYASKWTAGFRHIYIHSVARKMQVEFVGAPPQYCFEQYEIRLLDETGSELLHLGIISVDEMYKDGSSIYGIYNFTNLEYDRVYIPSVIPMERAYDGRCLCPVQGSNPYDIKVVCSCIAADWKPVRINRLDVLKSIEDNSTLHPTLLNAQSLPNKNQESQIWIHFFILNLFFCIVICVSLLYYHGFFHKLFNPKPNYKRHVRFVAQNMKNGEGDVEMGNGDQLKDCSLTSSVSISSTPLLLNPQMNLLIVYNHDSPVHEDAVLALAEYLRDVYNLQISLDCWDTSRIESNLVDYIAASVFEASKVIVVNSLAARERYMAKIAHNDFSVERKSPELLDKIFLQQIDVVLQHQIIISTRFNYSSHSETLPQLLDSLNYVVPNNMATLVSAIFGKNMKNDSRLSGYSPQLVKLEAKIRRATEYYTGNSRWFIDTHFKHTHKDPKACMTSSTTMTTIAEVEPTVVPSEATTTDISEGTAMDNEMVSSEPTTIKEQIEIAIDVQEQTKLVELKTENEDASAAEEANNDSGVEVHMLPTCSSTVHFESDLSNGYLETNEEHEIHSLKTSGAEQTRKDACQDDSGVHEFSNGATENPHAYLTNGYTHDASEKLIPKMGSVAVGNKKNRDKRKRLSKGGGGEMRLIENEAR